MWVLGYTILEAWEQSSQVLRDAKGKEDFRIYLFESLRPERRLPGRVAGSAVEGVRKPDDQANSRLGR